MAANNFQKLKDWKLRLLLLLKKQGTASSSRGVEGIVDFEAKFSLVRF